MMRYDWPYMMQGYGYGFAGWIPSLIFWIVVIAIVVALVKHLAHVRGGEDEGVQHMHKGGNALNILKERYAKGELTKKEFEEMKKDIS